MIEVIDFTCNGKCSNCGDCCTAFLPLTKKEYYTIKEYLKIHPEIECERHVRTDGIHVLCPFRDDKLKRCKIYEVRPYACRNFLCSKKVDTLLKERDRYMSRAWVNGSDTISLQRLFFNDIEWEFVLMYKQLNCDSIADFVWKINLAKPAKINELLVFASSIKE